MGTVGHFWKNKHIKARKRNWKAGPKNTDWWTQRLFKLVLYSVSASFSAFPADGERHAAVPGTWRYSASFLGTLSSENYENETWKFFLESPHTNAHTLSCAADWIGRVETKLFRLRTFCSCRQSPQRCFCSLRKGRSWQIIFIES